MNAKIFSCCLFCLIMFQSTYSQDQSILVFDPNNVSTSFQSTLSQLTEDSVFIADSLDNSIFNYDALFLFLNNTFILSQDESDRLIQYTSANKPVYIYSDFIQAPSPVAFWTHIGIEEFYGLLISVLVDSVNGIETDFTNGVTIDTSFMSGYIPVAIGNVDSILIGKAQGWEVNTTYKSGYDSLNVIVDLYNLIDDYGFLERVLQKFGLIPSSLNIQIQFFPQVDTALVSGGCTTPEYVFKSPVNVNNKDSISIEHGFNTYFYYFDSTGTQIPLDNFYFIVNDSLDEYDYEIWFHPKSYPPFEPILIEFDSLFYSEQNDFDIQLIVKKNGVRIDSVLQPFHADFGLAVDDTLNQMLPNDYELYQNYPNPYNISTFIKYYVPNQVSSNNGLVTLIVYDALGNYVTTLVNEPKSEGEYIVPFDGTNLSSGIYFYQLKVGNYIETKKMVFLK